MNQKAVASIRKMQIMATQHNEALLIIGGSSIIPIKNFPPNLIWHGKTQGPLVLGMRGKKNARYAEKMLKKHFIKKGLYDPMPNTSKTKPKNPTV